MCTERRPGDVCNVRIYLARRRKRFRGPRPRACQVVALQSWTWMHINLLPWNPVAGANHQRPSKFAVNCFCDVLAAERGVLTPFVQRVVLWLKRRAGSSQGRLNASLPPDRTGET